MDSNDQLIPDSEKWLYQKDIAFKLDKAIAWAETNKPKNNFAEIVKKIDNV